MIELVSNEGVPPGEREPSGLEVRGLSKSFGQGGGAVRVLEGIDLDLPPGSLAAVVGPSGCGKSTLLHMLGLLERPDAGSIRLDGVETTALGEKQAAFFRNRSVGFVFQFDHLLPELTLSENVAVPLRLAGLPRRASLERAEEQLSTLGLDDLAGRFPRELSGGERQRGAIARALVTRPRLLLADEPTGNLDPANASRALALFRDVARDRSRIALLVTHDPAIAEGCDKIFRLERTSLREAPND
jgi:ABC-type lipoprotein export system ATPase subunit